MVEAGSFVSHFFVTRVNKMHAMHEALRRIAEEVIAQADQAMIYALQAALNKRQLQVHLPPAISDIFGDIRQ